MRLRRICSETLDKGEGDIPVLIKHLPNPEEAQKNAIYLNTFQISTCSDCSNRCLQRVQSGGNADAVLGDVWSK